MILHTRRGWQVIRDLTAQHAIKTFFKVAQVKSIIPLVIIVLACSAPKADLPTSAEDSASSAITAAKVQRDVLPIPDSALPGTDSSLYIGEIRAFDETREYYTPVYYRPHLQGSGYYELLTSKTDSLVYKDDERSRKRLPCDIARQYFNLSGLEAVSVYANGGHVSDAAFVRVELLDDVIESQFIAVFQPLDTLHFNTDVSYCISGGYVPGKKADLKWESVEDSTLTAHLLDTFHLDSKKVWRVVHRKTSPARHIFSGITFQNQSLLIETSESVSAIVKIVNKDYYIGDIMPVCFEVNGKPVLLLDMGVNETDVRWTSLAVFSGKEYKFARGNRLSGMPDPGL